MDLDVRKWLQAGGFGQLADLFEAHQIDGDALVALTEEHLRELGIALGPRVKLLAAIQNLSARPAADPGAERRHLTVMFVDLVGSTALSSRLDPEDLRKVMRAYLDTVAAEVARYQGHVARYQGDGVMAYFGYPKAHEDAAERAVRAALGLVRAVAAVPAPGPAPLAARVGIATGLVVVGDLLGEGAAKEHAVVGETPNLAARLQAVAAPGEIVLSEQTRTLIGDLFELRDLGAQKLNGIAGTLAYCVLGERAVESRFEAHRALQLAAMVGRDGELALLRDRWRSAVLGEGQVVFVTGEGGIGKSRMLRALEVAVAGEPHVRIHNQCSPYHADSALFPAIQQLTRAAGIQPGDGVDTRLERLENLLSGAPAAEVALIAALLGIDGAKRYGRLELTPAQQRLQTFDALTMQLVRLANERPVLWVLEDAHWIDPTTLELFDACIERVSQLRLLAVITARPEFQHDFGRRRHLTRISLNRLGRTQIAAMVTGMTRGKALPEPLMDQIVAKTDGVPLFVEELTRALLESGVFHETEDAFVLDGPLEHLAVPASLHDSLMARLDRPQPLKEVAQIAACIGREFDFRLLSVVSGLEGDSLREALARLVDAQLIFRRGLPQEGRYAFKHALVRDAAYESLLKTRRQQIHTRLVAALEAVPETPPELVAHHATQAGLANKAIEYWQKAGIEAIARPAYKEAIAHLNQAMQLAEQRGESRAWQERRLLLLMALGQASIPLRGYSHSQTVAIFMRAQQLAASMPDAPHRQSIAYAVWVAHYVRGEHDQALETARAMLEQAKHDRNEGHRLTALRALAISQMITGTPRLACELFEQARELAEALRAQSREQRIALAHRFAADPEIATQFHACLTLWCLGQVDEAAAVCAQAVAAARAMGHAHTLGHALAHGAIFAVVSGSVEEALRLSAETMEFALKNDMELWNGYGSILHAYALALKGDAARSAPLMESGFASMARTQTGAMVPVHHALHACTLARLGRFEEAAGHAALVREELRSGSERYFWPECQRLLGDYLLLCPGASRAEAEAAYSDALATARKQEAKSWQLRAAASLARLRARGDSLAR